MYLVITGNQVKAFVDDLIDANKEARFWSLKNYAECRVWHWNDRCTVSRWYNGQQLNFEES